MILPRAMASSQVVKMYNTLNNDCDPNGRPKGNFLDCIWDALLWNLGGDIGYSDIFRGFPQPSKQIQGH